MTEPEKPVPTAQTINGQPIGNPGPHKTSPWKKFRKWPTWAQITTALVGVMLLIGIVTPTEKKKSTPKTVTVAGSRAPVPIEQDDASGNAVPIEPEAQPKPVKKTPKKPELTSGQERAIEAAQQYVDMSGFSKAGLIQQLSSPYGSGFSKADATFAVNHIEVNWTSEAVESARSYLEMSPMSESELIQQLSSSAGEQYTLAQAKYAVRKVY